MIDEIFASRKHDGHMFSMSMPASPKDFHGDGRFINGNINIVYVDRFLRSKFYIRINQKLVQFKFVITNIGRVIFDLFRMKKLSTDRVNFSSNRIMSILSPFHSLFRSCQKVLSILRLRTITWLNSIFEKSLIEGRSTHSAFSRKFLNRFSRKISVNKYFSKRRLPSIGDGALKPRDPPGR